MPPKPQDGPQQDAGDKTLQVFGCMFMPQMRTLCAVLDLNDIKYTHNDINIFDGEEYLDW